MAVAFVEATGDLTGLLDVRKLVFADGHDIALAEQDVASLVHGIGEQKAGERVAGGLLLGLHRGVALKLGLGAQGKERQHELVERRYLRVGEDDGLLRVDAAGQIVDDHVIHVVLDVCRGVTVGDDLVVCDDNAGGDAKVLQRHALADGAEVMAQMQPARRAVAREHAVFARVHGKVGANLIAAFLAGFEAIAHHALTFIVRREFSSCSSIALMPDAGAHHLKAFDARP